MQCPIARSLECVGEWWSLLIVRDAFQGLSRFDEFQRSLGKAPNILTRRLKHLTENGRDLFPVLLVMFAWGSKHLGAEGVALLQVDRRNQREIKGAEYLKRDQVL